MDPKGALMRECERCGSGGGPQPCVDEKGLCCLCRKNEAVASLNKAISIGRFPIVSDRDTILALAIEARDALLRAE